MGLKGPDKEEEMYFFVEFHIKNQKKWVQQWEKAQSRIPANSYFIQKFSSKDWEIAIAVWDFSSQKTLEAFIREYFDDCSAWKCFEMDRHQIEGMPLKKAS
ncbi:MAG: hypothetical protein FJZ63_00630 [Chlamydiae bacterium]|nr:hypothetical protein [Chlamydiota bacterium]